MWKTAQESSWTGSPVWYHGDMNAANLLVQGGWLSAMIDFGVCGVGDPACDLVIAWSFFHGDSLAAFRREVSCFGLANHLGSWRSWQPSGPMARHASR